MDSSRFDELTKALATSTSRRQALQRIGGTLVGSILAAWPFTQALAAGGGNSACAHFCAAVFGADTPAAGQCTSDAAHHKGLCYSCGPASSGGTKPICCPGGSGHCTSYSSATCCSAGQSCQNGQCVAPTTTTTTTPAPTTTTTTTPPCMANGGTCSGNSGCCSGNCSNGVCCASGQVGLSNGSCATPCSSQDSYCNGPCGQGGCNPDASGTLYCSSITGPEGGNCTTDIDCQKGYFCYYLGGPPSNFCFGLC